jgi:hypothetical protein
MCRQRSTRSGCRELRRCLRRSGSRGSTCRDRAARAASIKVGRKQRADRAAAPSSRDRPGDRARAAVGGDCKPAYTLRRFARQTVLSLCCLSALLSKTDSASQNWGDLSTPAGPPYGPAREELPLVVLKINPVLKISRGLSPALASNGRASTRIYGRCFYVRNPD